MRSAKLFFMFAGVLFVCAQVIICSGNSERSTVPGS